MRLVILILLSFSTVLSAEVRLVDNTECIADDDPIRCCNGLNAGTCDGKVIVSRIMVRHTMIEHCQMFWQSVTCADTSIDTGDDGIGDQWLVETGVCTQPQANAFKRLNDPDNTFMVICNANRQTDKECRAKNNGSTIMPKVADCRKLYRVLLDDQLKLNRNKGRDAWLVADAGPKDPNNDSIED